MVNDTILMFGRYKSLLHSRLRSWRSHNRFKM